MKLILSAPDRMGLGLLGISRRNRVHILRLSRMALVTRSLATNGCNTGFVRALCFDCDGGPQ